MKCPPIVWQVWQVRARHGRTLSGRRASIHARTSASLHTGLRSDTWIGLRNLPFRTSLRRCLGWTRNSFATSSGRNNFGVVSFISYLVSMKKARPARGRTDPVAWCQRQWRQRCVLNSSALRFHPPGGVGASHPPQIARRIHAAPLGRRVRPSAGLPSTRYLSSPSMPS